jgi:2'-5' RNA ligase
MEEPVYVLTLKTSEEIARQMQMLRQKWFPADRLKVPAHVTLFHGLPESRIAQASSQIESLAQRMTRFEISTGRIIKTKKGVLVHLETGEDEARRIFVSLRTSWWEWLGEQDKSFKAHWTVQNKEDDAAKVDEAYKDTHRIGTGLGWATGLVLWRYESDGKWTKEKEFEFARSGRERRESQEAAECDGWPVY